MPLPRSTIYIDGFNFYFGIFEKHPEWKWLNLESFFCHLRNRENVVAVKYFTAVIDPKKEASLRRTRQETYLAALSTLQRVQIIHGVFQPRTVRCDADCRQEYTVPEEKKTDVNIALAMVMDCIGDNTDSVVLVSGDSHQEPAIHWITKNCPQKHVTVYIPVLPEEQNKRRVDFYNSIGVLCRPLPLDNLSAHQLRNCVKVEAGRFACRPGEWHVPPAS